MSILRLPEMSGSERKHDIVLGCYATHINYGVTHAAERCIDTYICGLGNLLERHISIVAHHQHLTLIVGKHFYYTAYIFMNLTAYKLILNICIA